MSEGPIPNSVKSETAKVRRNIALDFTKGALVLIMVLYHWINYFIGPDWPWYFYLRFLTPSFIFVSGFIISNVYLKNYAKVDAALVRRLLTRGMKLLGLFVVLNVIRTALLPKTSGSLVGPDMNFLQEVFVTGNVSTATGKLVAFYILIPISYLLILSATLLLPGRSFKYAFHFACSGLLLAIAVLGMYGIRSYNLEFVAIGLLGTLIGFFPIAKINTSISHPIGLAVAYSCYLIAITLWNVPFVLLVPGTALSVMVIYFVGVKVDIAVRAIKHAVLLGKYSLWGYIAQIAILQILRVALRPVRSELIVLGLSFVSAFGLTSITVELADKARQGSSRFDKVYRFVFA